jgi:Tfp pilus assembly PilM family ATPase
MVERLLAAVRGAGLTPIGLDMAAFALIRCLYRRDTNGAGRVLYLNVDGLTNVAIAEGTTCRFTRVLGGGIEEIAASLAERTGMPLAHARGLLASVDLTDSPAPPPSPAAPAPPAPTLDVPALGFDAATAQEPHVPAGAESPLAEARPAEEHASLQPHASGEAHLPAEAHVPPDLIAPPHEPSVEEVARSVLENGIRAIAGEVRNSIDFHRSQEGGEGVSRVMLSGAALELTGFAEVLEGALGVEVHSATVGLADGHRLEGASPQRFAVAAGLATTEVPQ